MTKAKQTNKRKTLITLEEEVHFLRENTDKALRCLFDNINYLSSLKFLETYVKLPKMAWTTAYITG